MAAPRIQQPLTGFHLKLVALVTMIIDHAGAVFFPGTGLFRTIGRIAFPIYAFLIAEGCRHTRNRRRYLMGLGLFALVSEIPFDLAFGDILVGEKLPRVDFLRHTNVFFTLFFAVAAIHIYETLRRQHRKTQLAGAALGGLAILLEGLAVAFIGEVLPCALLVYVWILTALFLCDKLPEGTTPESGNIVSAVLAAVPTLLIFFLAEITNCDYRWFGVLLIVALYLAGTPGRASVFLAAAMALYYGVLYGYGFHLGFLAAALAAAGLTALYGGERGRNVKWPFYWAYPGHIAVLAALRFVLF